MLNATLNEFFDLLCPNLTFGEKKNPSNVSDTSWSPIVSGNMLEKPVSLEYFSFKGPDCQHLLSSLAETFNASGNTTVFFDVNFHTEFKRSLDVHAWAQY